jgi:hypothetical protein
MSKMNLPGFTAEVSLFKTENQYQGMRVSTLYSGQKVQIAQLPSDFDRCIRACGDPTNSGYDACSNFCNCFYKSNNSIFRCILQYIDDLSLT